MFIYDTVFKNDEEIRAFVSEAEEKYKTQILKIADHIKNTPDVKFLTLAGMIYPTMKSRITNRFPRSILRFLPTASLKYCPEKPPIFRDLIFSLAIGQNLLHIRRLLMKS